LTYQPDITEAFVIKYVYKPWDWKRLTRVPNISCHFIHRHPDKDWDWGYVSKKPDFYFELLKDYPDKPWVYCDLFHSVYKLIPWKFIEAHPEKPWNWFVVSRKKHIPIDFILKYPSNNYDWYKLISDGVLFESTVQERECYYRRVFAKRRIWRAWFRANTNPDYALCRKRLLKDYIALINKI
jgi:hypothetical protein